VVHLREHGFAVTERPEDDLAPVKRRHGVPPALESCHALAYAAKMAPRMKQDQILLINLSGRGDKDMHTVAQRSGIKL